MSASFFKLHTKISVLFSLALALTACGGGGSNSATPAVNNPAPNAPNQAPSAPPAELLYVPNNVTNSVEVFDASANGNVAPLFSIATASCGLNRPTGVAVDAHGKIYISNLPFLPEFPFISVVTVAGTTPSLIGVIQGNKTLLDVPSEVAVDSAGNVYTANDHQPSIGTPSGITEYAAGATGNVAPIAQITGPNTQLVGFDGPTGVALDSKNTIYGAMNTLGRVVGFPAGSNGNVSPTIDIFGSNAFLADVWGIAVDSAGKLYVVNSEFSTISIYAAGATGNVAPVALISGPDTTLTAPIGIAIGRTGKIYVTDAGAVIVFAPGATGDAKPIARISGPATGFPANRIQVLGYPAVH